MTIEQYLECSADILEKMTDQQLEEHFREMFPITRPELGAIPKEAKKSTTSSTLITKPTHTMTPEELAKKEKRDRAAQIAKEMGFGELFSKL